jgi:ABC-2 type transport system permease protein
MLTRIYALVIKEILDILRNRQSRLTLIIPPLMQLFIISQAATLEVKNISICVFNLDSGWYSHELIERLKGSKYFSNIYQVHSQSKLEASITDQKAIAALVIQDNFSQKIASGYSPSIQIILDGRRANSSQIVQGYISRILQNFNSEIRLKQDPTLTQPVPVFRSWYNPNLDFILYTVPCLVGILSMVLAMMVTSLSVAREREMGTFDQLLVSPLSSWEILAGKMIPALIIAVAESSVIMICAIVAFSIPFQGSLLLFYFSMVVFIISIIGVGLFISSLSYTQQQAILGTFVFIMPTILLSGFATPIENMPVWLQPVAWCIPMSYFFVIIKGIFLKDMSMIEVLNNLWPMALIAIVTLLLAGWMFKKRLE